MAFSEERFFDVCVLDVILHYFRYKVKEVRYFSNYVLDRFDAVKSI